MGVCGGNCISGAFCDFYTLLPTFPTSLPFPTLLLPYCSAALLPCCSAALLCHRDPKGLYMKARAGLIPHFTGIDAPYEVRRPPFPPRRAA